MDSEVSKSSTDGEAAIRVRDLLRQIGAGHELEIVSGNVARDDVHLFLSLSTESGSPRRFRHLDGSANGGSPCGHPPYDGIG